MIAEAMPADTHQPTQAGRQRRGNHRRHRSEHRERAVAHPHVAGSGDRHRHPAELDRRGKSGGDHQRRADMADDERHDQPDGAQMQLGEGQQAGQEGQPEVERTGIDDERAAQQRPHVPMGQVVQVGAGALNDDVMRVGAKHQDGATDGKQHRHITDGELDPGEPGKDAPKSLTSTMPTNLFRQCHLRLSTP